MRKHKITMTLLIFLSVIAFAKADIIVSNYGYLPFGKKEAMTLIDSESFSLLDKATDRKKFTGKKDGPFTDPVTGQSVYRLNFTNQVRGGDYYLSVGDRFSKIFKIDSGAFNPVFVAAMDQITKRRGKYGWLNDRGEEDIYLSSYMVTRGLSYYETFMDRFGDGELAVPEGENKIADFADELIFGTKGLLKWYQETSANNRDVSEVAAVLSAFAIAGRVLPRDNAALAKESASLAEDGYQYLLERKDDIRGDLWLLILSELNLLTDKKEFEDLFRSYMEQMLVEGWGPINSEDLTGFALGEMMKKSLDAEDKIYDRYFERSVELLMHQEKDPYFRAVSYSPIDIDEGFKGIYLKEVDPTGLGSEGLYMIDLNEYYKTSVWAKSAQDQLQYLLGRNPEGIDYLEKGSLETVFHIALLAANFKDSSKLTRTGQVVGGAFRITFYMVLVFAGITLWQKFSTKREDKES